MNKILPNNMVLDLENNIIMITSNSFINIQIDETGIIVNDRFYYIFDNYNFFNE